MKTKDYKIIVIEGVDSSGKATQSQLLAKRLENDGKPVISVEFPNYKSDSSSVVKMYLNGDFGLDPNSVSPYAASTFFAVDRFASVNGEWKDYFSNGNIVIADRYTTSNMVHQASKIANIEEKSKFLDWLYDFEYNKVAIPKPDKVIFLDMPIEVSQKLLSKRYQGDESKKDIHESDTAYLERCRKAAVFTAEYSNWEIIPCSENGEARTIEAIAQDVLDSVLKLYKEDVK